MFGQRVEDTISHKDKDSSKVLICEGFKWFAFEDTEFDISVSHEAENNL